MKKLAVAPAALMLGALAALAPAMATSQGTTPTVSVLDSASCPGGALWPYCFQAGAGSYNPTLSIPVGGTVAFTFAGNATYPADVDFGSSRPSSCTGLPTAATTSAWSGSCTFNVAGSYPFHSDGVPYATYMYGTINVAGGSPGTTSSPPTTGTTAYPSGSVGAGPGAGGSPSAPSVATAPASLAAAIASVHAAGQQTGSAVTVRLSSPQGGLKATVELLAPAAQAARTSAVLVGRKALTTTGSGAVVVHVGLSARGRRALTRHHRLRLTVRVKLSAPGAGARTTTRTVTLFK